MRRVCMTILTVLTMILLPVAAGALEAPHNYVPLVRNITCAQCHIGGRSAGLKRLDNLCYACHVNSAYLIDRTVSAGDASNIFKTITTSLYKPLPEALKKMTDHNWIGPDNNAAAGAVAPGGTLSKTAVLGTVSCARCHWVHSSGTAYQLNRPLLRMANDEDQMCFECHKPRNTRSHTTGSHPVRFNYASSATLKPGIMKPVISNNNAGNLTSDLSRYLKKGRVVCSTCHKIHQADSNSASYDSYTSIMQVPSSVANGKGMLLRTDFRAALGADPNICQNCHTYKNHNKRAGTNIQCTDCHGAHVNTDLNGNVLATPNILLLNRYINYSAVVKGANVRTKSVFFTTTSGTVRNFYTANQLGMCEICHPATSLPVTVTEHSNASDLNAGDKRCRSCHPHAGTSSFTPNGAAACGTCHGRPPYLAVAGNTRYAGGAQGGYAVYTAVGANEWSYRKIGASNRPDYKDESTTPHNRHSEGYYDDTVTTTYAFDCNECHNGNSHRTQTYEDVFTTPSVNYVKSHPRPGDAVTVPIAGLFAKNFATYTSLNATDGACNNVYCHSNGAPRNAFNIYTAMVYRWPTGRYWGGGAGKISAAQGNRCSACHDAQPTTNAHLRHRTVNTGNPIMGSTIVCTDCHKATYSLTNYTSINLNQSLGIKHVNGLKDIAFDTSKYPGVTFNLGKASCTGYCHVSKPSASFAVYTASWAIPNTNGCGFCHAFPPTSGAHVQHMTNSSLLHKSYTSAGVWSDGTNYAFGCANCHPKDVSKHIDNIVQVNLYKDDGGAGGPLKGKNRFATNAAADGINLPGSGISGTKGSNVVCFSSYCHSNGMDYLSASFRCYTTPDWYNAAAYTGDKCAMCHGNSPNSTRADGKYMQGSPAHYNTNSMGTGRVGGHFVGIHYNDIYSGGNGKATAGNTPIGSHGNSGTSATINCHTCHNATVTNSRNDNNTVCFSCHGGQSNPATIASKSMHVNGAINVDFNLVQVKSKAQMRQKSFDLYSAAVLKRYPTNSDYKTSGAYDQGKTALANGMWTSGTRTCANVSCHNGVSITWTTDMSVNTCSNCHSAL